MVLVSLEASTGTINRYEACESGVRLTHTATFGRPVTFSRGVVEQMRVRPPQKFAEDPFFPPETCSGDDPFNGFPAA